MRVPLAMCLALAWSLTGLALGAAAGDDPVDYAGSIKPILARRCLGCHGPEKQKAGLRLDARKLALKGGDSGPAIVPGKAAESAVLERIVTSDASIRMPLQKPALPAAEIDLLRRWIDQGATWPETESGRRASSHWSFRPIANPELPTVQNASWPRDPIDRFVLAGLEPLGIAPAREADQPTLLRRLSLDLTGLLPTPEEVAAFLADPGPNAYEKAVDRLLASPAFGERWAGYWLDLARYADSDGFEQDDPRPFAYRWRDWVINAINTDIPFDRFTIEQIAGDLLPSATEDQILATGFHRNTPADREGGIDKEDARRRSIVDRVNTVGTVWLGLTVGCAECHSHKFDPISADEYYSLYAFFNDETDDVDRPTTAVRNDLERHALAVKAFEERVARLAEQVEKAPPEQKPKLQTALERVKKRGPPELKAELAVLGALNAPRRTHVHKGGNYKNEGRAVEPATPAVLPPLALRDPGRSRADRLDLAYWLVDPSNPLPARVEANRIWQNLFGEGLVTTPDDFGSQGARPGRPELLDHLARRLVQGRWSRKKLVRAIVCSSAYRQASRRRPEIDARDPLNRLIARQNRYRLDAEIVRDITLQAAGLLNPRVGGPSMRPPVPASFKSFAFQFRWATDPPEEVHRRAMYIFLQRNMVFPTLPVFDRPDTNVTCVKRERSNTPLQALILLNDPEELEAARALALRTFSAATRSIDAGLDELSRICLGAGPPPRERTVLAGLYAELRNRSAAAPSDAEALLAGAAFPPGRPADAAAWVGVCRVMLNTDAFVSRE